MDIPASQLHPILRLYTKTQPSDPWASQFQTLQLSDPQREGDYFRYSILLDSGKDQAAPIDDSVLPRDRPQLQAAVAALRQSPLQGVIVPPDYLRDTFNDCCR